MASTVLIWQTPQEIPSIKAKESETLQVNTNEITPHSITGYVVDSQSEASLRTFLRQIKISEQR